MNEANPPGPVPVPNSSDSLTRNQIRGFWASWGGWTLDGMDSFVYALVLVPSLRELLPRSGIAATKANIGQYGGLLFALFLVGWGLAFLWGPVGDKFGRVRTLMLTIVWYSVFTFLSAFVTSVWQLAILRLLAGIGIGGEWAMGGTFVAEEWPESRRRMGAGFMHTGYYVGIFLAALANYGIGSHYGWRAMFIVGGAPALLLAWIRHGVVEPAAWKKKESVVRSWAVWRPFATLFSPAWRRRTVINALLMLAACGRERFMCPQPSRRWPRRAGGLVRKRRSWPPGASCWSRSQPSWVVWQCRGWPRGLAGVGPSRFFSR